MKHMIISLLTSSSETIITLSCGNTSETVKVDWGKRKPGFPIIGLFTVLVIFYFKKIKSLFAIRKEV